MRRRTCGSGLELSVAIGRCTEASGPRSPQKRFVNAVPRPSALCPRLSASGCLSVPALQCKVLDDVAPGLYLSLGPDLRGSRVLIGDVLYPLAANRRTTGSIISWWESRRPTFNLIVGSAGVVTLGVVKLISWLPPHTLMPIAWQPVVVYGVLANV